MLETSKVKYVNKSIQCHIFIHIKMHRLTISYGGINAQRGTTLEIKYQ